jgi:FkbM family methyltransferase
VSVPEDRLASLSLAELRAASYCRRFVGDPVRRLRLFMHCVTRPIEVDCTIFTGQRMRVVLPEIVGADIYRYRYIEPPLTRVLLDHLRPGMIFVDVGAHYGYHSIVASQAVGRQGLVFAFEPARSTFRLLLRNVERLENVRAHQLALCSANGTTVLRDFGLRHSALNTLTGTAKVPPAERRRLQSTSYPVPCVTLDELLLPAGLIPDVVKLDAEGSELSILRGMSKILKEGNPMVTVEAGDYEGMQSPATADCIDFLSTFGYRCLEYADGLRPHVRRSRYGYDNLYFRRAK